MISGKWQNYVAYLIFEAKIRAKTAELPNQLKSTSEKKKHPKRHAARNFLGGTTFN